MIMQPINVETLTPKQVTEFLSIAIFLDYS